MMTTFSNPVDQAITSRKSVRAFLNTPVPEQTVRHLLEVACRAPSGNNAQPWWVMALTGEPLQSLTEVLVAEAVKLRSPDIKPNAYEYDYYPEKWIDPFLSRRRKVGFDLYAALNISKDNILGRQQQFEENYRFFWSACWSAGVYRSFYGARRAD
jgi:nitroreductase